LRQQRHADFPGCRRDHRIEYNLVHALHPFTVDAGECTPASRAPNNRGTPMTRLSKFMFALWAGFISCASVHAQNFPTRPIRLLIGSPPGGGADFVARALTPKLSEGLGQSVVIENRPG